MRAETFYTIEEAAHMLKLHPQTVRRWIRQGKLPARQFGKQFRLRPEDVERFTQPTVSEPAQEANQFDRLAPASMVELWDNEEDAIYDDWRALYGVAA